MTKAIEVEVGIIIVREIEGEEGNRAVTVVLMVFSKHQKVDKNIINPYMKKKKSIQNKKRINLDTMKNALRKYKKNPKNPENPENPEKPQDTEKPKKLLIQRKIRKIEEKAKTEVLQLKLF